MDFAHVEFKLNVIKFPREQSDRTQKGRNFVHLQLRKKYMNAEGMSKS
jgi:hypothetical protein